MVSLHSSFFSSSDKMLLILNLVSSGTWETVLQTTQRDVHGMLTVCQPSHEEWLGAAEGAEGLGMQ